MNSIATVTGLSKAFGSQQVFTDLSLSIYPGSILGIVGLNGTGKTTLIKLLLGLLKANSGTIDLCGFDPWRHDPLMYRRLGVVLEQDGLYGNLTGLENLSFFAKAGGIGREEMKQYIRETWPEIMEFPERKKVKYLSRGQKKRIALCRAFAGNPRVCFLDEPDTGLDVRAFDHLQTVMKEAAAQGTAIVISSHLLTIIEHVCDRIAVIENHRLRLIHEHEAPSAGPVEYIWEIDAGGDPEAGKMIETFSSGTAEYNGSGWRFAVGSEDTIPDIVHALVKSGLRVRRVQPAGDTLHEKVKKVYQC